MYTITHSHGAPLEEPLTLPVRDTEAWAEAERIGIDLQMLYEHALATPDQRMRDHAGTLRRQHTYAPRMSHSMGGLEELLRRLIDAGVSFVLIGGYAAVVHGAVDLTRDIDVCIPFDEENLLRLQAALGELNPLHRITQHHAPLELRVGHTNGWRNLYLKTDKGMIDCLGEVLGLGDFEKVLAVSEELATSIGSFRLLTIPALIVAKEAVGRPHDLRTAAQLRCVLDVRQNPAGK